MWEYEYSHETRADAGALWRHWADMAGWSQWNDGIEAIDVEGPFAVGTTFTMTPPGALLAPPLPGGPIPPDPPGGETTPPSPPREQPIRVGVVGIEAGGAFTSE